MNIQERINNSNLPQKQLRVIQSILNDLESNSFLSGQEICHKFDISFSSLTRMAKSLDFKGFPQLKKEIESLYKDESSPTIQAENFLKRTDKNSILDAILDDEVNNIAKLKSSLKEDDLFKVAKNIYSSKRIFIIGIGQLKPIIRKLANNLELLGKEVIELDNVGFSKEFELHNATSSDLVILISVNKELTESFEFLNTLLTKEITSILLTDRKYGLLQKSAAISLFAPSKGSGILSNLCSYHILTNIIESYLFSLDEHVHLRKIKNIEKSWSSLPIFLQ
ncbi:MurR/RpiR family transcriptional regulator [Halobacteriovorax sp. HLS]|uniref:MurR/RpiR family transcriptional regulator n=1 Tax=Halobacteriovorax sp. HLS TaxID=2234000 RepID=UPI000FD6BA3B|nr:MurR/RpiR family transcriptional regulator [Halobacteriovorax sp. HLS]